MKHVMISCLGGTPSDTRTVLLMHCDGANNETTFTDSSSYNKSLTAYGNAKKTTSFQKFGTASAIFDGSGDRIEAGSSADFAFGTGDFTVEMWIYVDSWTTDMVLCNVVTTGGFRLARSGATSTWGFGPEGSAPVVTHNVLPSTGAWHHIMASRASGTGYLFVDGSLVKSTSNTTNYAQAGLAIGTNNFNGKIDEIRVSKGVARQTANFTPPTDAYLT